MPVGSGSEKRRGDDGGGEEEGQDEKIEGGERDEEVVEGFRLGKNITTAQRKKVLELLNRFSGIFAKEGQPLPPPKIDFEHKIETGDHPPIACPPIQCAPVERAKIMQEVVEMMKLGVIEPSNSAWGARVVLVKKPDGSARFCIDWRGLNGCTTRDVYPLCRTDDILDRLSGATWFSKIDLYKGFWQCPLRLEDRPKSAFITPDGLFQWTRMGFGLCNGTASFSRMMDHVLAKYKWHICLLYVDDILVFASSFDQHLERVEVILEALR